MELRLVLAEQIDPPEATESPSETSPMVQETMAPEPKDLLALGGMEQKLAAEWIVSS